MTGYQPWDFSLYSEKIKTPVLGVIYSKIPVKNNDVIKKNTAISTVLNEGLKYLGCITYQKFHLQALFW